MTEVFLNPPPISWFTANRGDSGQWQVAYRGPLAGCDLWLLYGFDGWQKPAPPLKLQRIQPELAVTEPIAVNGHLSLECVVTNGQLWDNNYGSDYRLWIDLDPVDAHLHASGNGRGELGIASLQTALASAGIRRGIVSWIDNDAMDRIEWSALGLSPLVWIRPGETTRDEVRARLAAGYVGLKLHPTVDDYQADDWKLDPYLEIAAEVGCPVACHSAPGEADPDHIRRLAERFPMVPVILYHTFLGPSEGRERATHHAREQSNLYLETSWCSWREVLQFVTEVGPDRVLFGSDASVDGHWHYCRRPPNIEGQETYNEGLLSLTRALGPHRTRNLLGNNARRLFRLGASPPDRTARPLRVCNQVR